MGGGSQYQFCGPSVKVTTGFLRAPLPPQTQHDLWYCLEVKEGGEEGPVSPVEDLEPGLDVPEVEGAEGGNGGGLAVVLVAVDPAVICK